MSESLIVTECNDADRKNFLANFENNYVCSANPTAQK
jgi:hypothetical protein